MTVSYSRRQHEWQPAVNGRRISDQPARPPIGLVWLLAPLFDIAIVVLLLTLLSGCASAVKIEAEHVSHPFAGWPFGPRSQEDGLTHVQGLAVWRAGNAYAEGGLGYNLRGVDGGGFHGPSLTGTLRVGLEVPLP